MCDDVNTLLWRSNLAAALLTRYKRRGERQDLDAAIERLHQVVRESPATDPGLPSRLGNLGRALHGPRAAILLGSDGDTYWVLLRPIPEAGVPASAMLSVEQLPKDQYNVRPVPFPELPTSGERWARVCDG